MRFASVTDRLADLGGEKWALHFRARALAERGEEIIELTVGEPDASPDPALLDACERAMRAGRTRYASGRGEPALLEALARKYARRAGRAVTTENVLCFPGTQTALYAVMTGLVEQGDAVIVPDPFYATYEGVVRATGAEVVTAPLRARRGFRLQPEDLEAAITPNCRALLLNTPHNPTGAVLPKSAIEEIGAICRRRDLWIVSDEVYEHLVFGGAFASPFDVDDLADRTIVVSSISKSHAATGFRSGWAVASPEVCRRLLPLSETMLFGNQPFIADMTAFAIDHLSVTAATLRERYERRARAVFRALADCPRLTPMTPEAGMFMMVDVSPTGVDGRRFAEALLEKERVATMPGSSFGAEAEGFIRLGLSAPEETLAEAARRIRRLAETRFEA